MVPAMAQGMPTVLRSRSPKGLRSLSFIRPWTTRLVEVPMRVQQPPRMVKKETGMRRREGEICRCRHQVMTTGTIMATMGVLLRTAEVVMRTTARTRRAPSLGFDAAEDAIDEVVHDAGFAECGGDDEESGDHKDGGVGEAGESGFGVDDAGAGEEDDGAEEEGIGGEVAHEAGEEQGEDDERDDGGMDVGGEGEGGPEGGDEHELGFPGRKKGPRMGPSERASAKRVCVSVL